MYRVMLATAHSVRDPSQPIGRRDAICSRCLPDQLQTATIRK